MLQEEILEKSKEKRGKQIPPEPDLFEDMPRKKGKTGIFLLLGILTGLFFIFWGPRNTIEGEAVLKSDHLVQIGAVTSGVLKELLHKKGDSVKAGEVLARFDNADISKELGEKQTKLEILKRNKLHLARKRGFLKKEKERKNLLFENGVIGLAKVEEAELDLTHASEELIDEGKGIESCQREIGFLKAKLETLEIKTPFAGVILEDSSEKTGNYFKEGDAVFDFVDPSTFYLELNVLEREIEKLRLGDSATIVFRTLPHKNYIGEIVKIGPKTEKEIEKVFKVKHVVPVLIKLSEFPTDARYGMRAWVQMRPEGKSTWDLLSAVLMDFTRQIYEKNR